MAKYFQLETKTAKTLYHKFVESMPIIDYHYRINPAEIAEDCRFHNIIQVWLGGAKLKENGMTARGLIRQSNVKAIGTTDDPVDTLEHHAARYFGF